MLYNHPCSIYEGPRLAIVQTVVVVSGAASVLGDSEWDHPWQGNLRLFPLPQLVGDQDYVADLSQIAVTRVEYLENKRIACLNLDQLAAFQGRCARHVSRLDPPLSDHRRRVEPHCTSSPSGSAGTKHGAALTATRTGSTSRPQHVTVQPAARCSRERPTRSRQSSTPSSVPRKSVDGSVAVMPPIEHQRVRLRSTRRATPGALAALGTDQCGRARPLVWQSSHDATAVWRGVLLPADTGHVPPCRRATFPLPNHVRQAPPSRHPGRRRRPNSAASWSSPSATPPARSRRRPAAPTSATGLRSRAGAPNEASSRSPPSRPPSRRSSPPRPTASSGRSRSPAARRRSPPRTAPRITPTRATPAPSPRSCPGSAASTAPSRVAPGRAAGARPAGAPDRADRHRHARRTARSGAAAARVRRRAAPLRARRPRRRGPRLRRRARAKLTIGKSKTDQERAGAQVAVPYARARDRCAVRALQAWLHAAGIHRGPVFRRMRRGDTLTDRAALRPVRRADRQAPRPGRRRPPRRSCPGTRCAPATRPRPRPPASRSARSPTSPATRTSPSCAATSAARPRSTTSAKCYRPPHATPSRGLPRRASGAGASTVLCDRAGRDERVRRARVPTVSLPTMVSRNR